MEDISWMGPLGNFNSLQSIEMNVLDAYYELDEQQQKKVNLQLSIEAGHLIDIQGFRYT
jgi:hypothetical protein